jgi:lysyl-tRNA synthetase class 2
MGPTVRPAEKQRLSQIGPSGRSRHRNLELRAEVLKAFRRAMDARGYLEIETPVLIAHPGSEPHLEAIAVSGGRYLATSPEYQMKRLLGAGFEKIYYLGKAFRAGERGPHHNPEFTMAEWYRSDCDYRGLAHETACVVEAVARNVNGSSRITDARGEKLDLAAPWCWLTVEEAFQRYAGIDDLWESCESNPFSPSAKGDDASRLRASAERIGVRVGRQASWEETFFRIFVERVEPRLGCGRPTVLAAWPPSLAALARLSSEGGKTYAERFEVFCGGLELANAFGELRDPEEQRLRLERDRTVRKKMRKPLYKMDESFLAALEQGLPPCSGIALGFDRLVMLLLGARRIQEVMAFTEEEL